MRAAWWWIDRWRQSTAYADMTAEEQGLLRNLLDEIWLRPNHVIPNDPKTLAQISGDYEAWQRCGDKVLQWMKAVDGGWTNKTALEVIGQSEGRAERQKRYRDKVRNTEHNTTSNTEHNTTSNTEHNEAHSLSPSPSLSLSPSHVSEELPPKSPPPAEGDLHRGRRRTKTLRDYWCTQCKNIIPISTNGKFRIKYDCPQCQCEQLFLLNSESPCASSNPKDQETAAGRTRSKKAGKSKK